jgi:hypothetical protein
MHVTDSVKERAASKSSRGGRGGRNATKTSPATLPIVSASATGFRVGNGSILTGERDGNCQVSIGDAIFRFARRTASSRSSIKCSRTWLPFDQLFRVSELRIAGIRDIEKDY